MLTTDTVSPLSTSDAVREATFVVLRLASGHNLTLTPTHHLPVGEACCSHLKLAKDVGIGDKVWVAAFAGVGIGMEGAGADDKAKALEIIAVWRRL